MATTTNITTTYAGEVARQYISAALLSGNTLANGGITEKLNIKYKEVVKRLATGDLIADGTCDFTATSNVDLDERIIEPKEFQVNLELCKKDFRSDWEAVSMGMSAFDKLPPNFQSYLLSHVVEKVAEKTEDNIWVGDDAVAGEFDGFVTLAQADADVIDVPTPVAITDANVQAEMRRLINLIPSKLYGKSDSYIYISQNVYRAYVASLGGFGANGLGANGYMGQGPNQDIQPLMFDGVKLFVANGLDDNSMLFAQKSNLWFGTGLLSDHNEVKILDMADTDGSQNVRIIMRFTATVQYGYGSEIVLYKA